MAYRIGVDWGQRVYTQIAPNDTFVAAFTPPRSGTYPYHLHFNDRQQISRGMYGAVIVSDGPRDLAHDHLVVAGGGGPDLETHIESPFALVNGRTPTRSGVWRLEVKSVEPGWYIPLTVIVAANQPVRAARPRDIRFSLLIGVKQSICSHLVIAGDLPRLQEEGE